jgi:hypothetical protein
MITLAFLLERHENRRNCHKALERLSQLRQTTMYQLQPGDRVRLKADISLSLNIRYLKQGARGKIVALDRGGYRVVFEDSEVAVEYLTDREIELDDELK